MLDSYNLACLNTFKDSGKCFVNSRLIVCTGFHKCHIMLFSISKCFFRGNTTLISQITLVTNLCVKRVTNSLQESLLYLHPCADGALKANSQHSQTRSEMWYHTPLKHPLPHDNNYNEIVCLEYLRACNRPISFLTRYWVSEIRWVPYLYPKFEP